jgi:hypothetical protein
MEESRGSLPWGARKRLHYLEFKLFWEGRVNRGDLKDAFGISTPQASTDIAKYQALAPNNMSYNPSGKFYVPAEEFRPVIITPTADAYFSEVLYPSFGDSSSSSWDEYIGVVPSPNRIVDESILRKIVQCIKNKQKIAVDYRSFKHPESEYLRWISPHAFGSDGFRWHVRAYCHNDNKFKDYVLGRIVTVLDTSDTEIEANLDEQWFSYIDVVIGPNPKLSDDQKAIVAMDYGMANGRLTLRCKIALLWYLLKKLGLDAKGAECAGEEQHIVLINQEEISSVM